MNDLPWREELRPPGEDGVDDKIGVLLYQLIYVVPVEVLLAHGKTLVPALCGEVSGWFREGHCSYASGAGVSCVFRREAKNRWLWRPGPPQEENIATGRLVGWNFIRRW